MRYDAVTYRTVSSAHTRLPTPFLYSHIKLLFYRPLVLILDSNHVLLPDLLDYVSQCACAGNISIRMYGNKMFIVT